MGGVAALARDLGFHVTGWDANVYPPMSTQLEKLGIELTSSLSTEQLEPAPDLVIIGNALSRGHPLVEYVLENGLPYQSGPEWLGHNLLRQKHVLAVAGTHGKTTTASMLTVILELAGLSPSFLVGGVVKPFGQTARLTDSDYFVIEADEYDTAFFDKRSKFLHYYPNVFTINNLEFDHADIFADLNAIQTQFAHGIRLIPRSGSILAPIAAPAVETILERGYWSKLVPLNDTTSWSIADSLSDGSAFSVHYAGECVGRVEWALLGEHNMQNALMAIAAAHQVGVTAATSCSILSSFEAPARRMELLGVHNRVHVYDDFAHHPTAIATTLKGLREKLGVKGRIVAIFEPRSNTMKSGIHGDSLVQAFALADRIYALQPNDAAISLPPAEAQSHWAVETCVQALVARIMKEEKQPGHWVIMSNGGFGGIHQQLLDALQAQEILHGTE